MFCNEMCTCEVEKNNFGGKMFQFQNQLLFWLSLFKFAQML